MEGRAKNMIKTGLQAQNEQYIGRRSFTTLDTDTREHLLVEKTEQMKADFKYPGVSDKYEI